MSVLKVDNLTKTFVSGLWPFKTPQLYTAVNKDRDLMFKSVTFISIAFIFGLLWYISPVFKQFSKPTGIFSVGTKVVEFTDQTRKETFAENPEDKRALVVRFFYPANTTEGFEKYPYLGAKMPYYQKVVASYYHVPEFMAKLLFHGMSTNSYINAPLAHEQESYPVVLFSHGLLGLPSDTSLVILENLASHGYIVAVIDHPYLNALTFFADGRVVSSLPLSEQFNKMSQKEQKEFQTKAIDVYKADMKFLLDELTKLNQDTKSILYHRMNLGQIAAMGHSAGGTASIEFCRTDTRCKAAIDLDGWYDQVIGQEPINKPLLLMFGSKSLEVTEPTPEYLKRKELSRDRYFEREEKSNEHIQKLCSVTSCSFVVIPEAAHGDFGDEIFIKWPLRSWNAAESYKTMTMINEHIVHFFNRVLC
ncbi:hypothetical protein H0X48_04815 [Candidatus Dependentiae bacterium]|nr:hypothetical protein [Candidatus Dependentiae bacterium]